MNITKTVTLFFLMGYYYKYGIPPRISNYFFKLYIDFFHFFVIKYKLFYSNKSDNNEENFLQNKPVEQNNITIENKEQKKYEDKYIQYIKSTNKEWEFTEDEKQLQLRLNETFLNEYIRNANDKIEDITKEIIDIEKEILEDKDNSDEDFNYDSDYDSDGTVFVRQTLEERNENRRYKIKILQEEYNNIKNLIETDNGLDSLIIMSQEKSKQHIINDRLNKIKNCYVMEKTPIGNVLMIYDIQNRKFKYYSDSSIPYRYLEVVGRKYVKLFNCRPIFIDMEEELKIYDEKLEKEKLLKKEKEEEEEKAKMEEEKTILQITETKKKNVFAKFKSYNVNMGVKGSMVPPKNNTLNKTIIDNKENDYEKVLMKENSNSYIYDGKISNFNFLQKVEKKVFNKKLGFTFADFKKINKQ
jgi:hypothetical protein